ncbi:hypothetical protein ACVR0H_05305 [Streptococcus constellatus subsp. viborgensis]|uniref:hypothetical protein n=1 Tax=Streptococcus constellatus TaxID=76860 RepID=UPI00079B1323|nr:hypothetical protein [Streptococcus constellatus]KXU02866.1 hypothetical protein SCODD09_00110 [Streptococcus constellatus]QQC22899.1 hypothetical protein I6H72_09330 [Streptococcus constellatus]
MTLTTLKNDIKAFGKKKIEFMSGYVAMQEDYQKKLAEGMIGQKWADQELQNYKKEADTFSYNTSQSLYKQLEVEKKNELARYEAAGQSVTADDVAELSLLSTMKLSSKEMLSYLEKYKNKPLAIKKLLEIIHNDTNLTFIEIDIDKYDNKQKLEALFHLLTKRIDYFGEGLKVNGDKVDLAIHKSIVENSLKSIDIEVQKYLTV